MDAPDPPPLQSISRQAIGVALLGLGVPTAAAGAFLFRMAFLPSRGGRVLYVFSADHPLAIASGVLLLVGLPLVVAGLWLTRYLPSVALKHLKPLAFPARRLADRQERDGRG